MNIEMSEGYIDVCYVLNELIENYIKNEVDK